MSYEVDGMPRIIRGKYRDDDYEQVGLPNKPELSRLVKIAIGDDTMSKMAEACDTSLSTISRIVNPDYAIKEPINPELIRKIALYAADKPGIDLDALMKANGYQSRDEIANIRFEERDRLEREINSSIRSAITGSFKNNGYRYWEMQNSSKMYGIVPSRFDLDVRSDYLFMIQGIEPRFFNFCIDRTSFSERKDEELSLNRVARYTSLFLMDTWESDILRDYWNIIVFTRKVVFDTFKSQLQEIKVNGHISMLLIDLEEEKIVEEYVMPRNNGKDVKGLFA